MVAQPDLIEKHPVRGITIRKNIGSQLIAQLVSDYLKEIHVDQEFTHLATQEKTPSPRLTTIF
jgi:putative transposase